MKIKLYELSVSELNLLLDEVNSHLETLSKVDRLVSHVTALCEEHGVGVDVLANALSPKMMRGPKKGSARAVVLFKNAQGQRWTGRGNMPSWLKEQIRMGKKIDGFYCGPPEQRVEIVARYF